MLALDITNGRIESITLHAGPVGLTHVFHIFKKTNKCQTFSAQRSFHVFRQRCDRYGVRIIFPVLKLDSNATIVIGMLVRSHAIKESFGNQL